ncbi:MAG: hypothetical protein OEM38_05940 [Gammaproteobacteria bacterium]|nr:hypothetical protein [Gammaproteobacteria bacterium]
MTKIQQHTQTVVKSFNESILATFDKKACSRQYAAVLKNNKSVHIFEEESANNTDKV